VVDRRTVRAGAHRRIASSVDPARAHAAAGPRQRASAARCRVEANASSRLRVDDERLPVTHVRHPIYPV
jgi:hypothetical protein